jgi:hypothetical protein
MIFEYLETLSAALSFDQALAQRVRREVEDHLQQAVEADPSNGGIPAQRRVIAEFGDVQTLAAQFAMISVGEQMRKLGIALILVIAGVFVAMKGRVAWYAVAGAGLDHDMTALTRMVGSMDRYSFWLSAIIGAGSFAYVVGRPIPTLVDARCRRQLRCVLVSCFAVIAPLVVSVISDGVLTTIRLVGADLCAWSLVPVGTMVIEIACVGILAFQLWIMRLRTVSAVSLHVP